MRLTPRGNRRSGFTIIELLVVMSIVIAIAALSIGAVFSVRESQIKNSAETTVQKLSSALDQQFKAVLDQIYEETPNQTAMAQANNVINGQQQADIRRGRVIHTKMRLRQEFPINFTQATQTLGFVTGGTLTPKPAFQLALSGVSSDPPWSSSAMLYMILSQGRRGMAAFDPGTVVEPTAIQTGTVNGKSFQYFVDPWGNPLRFFLFPTGNDEINAEPYIRTVTPGPSPSVYTLGRDVQDPEDTLMSMLWNPVLRNDFRAKIHDLPAAGPNLPARHLIPIVTSSAKDGKWGINLTTMLRNPDSPPPPVEPPEGWGFNSDDNIYSYRLRRFGARGD